MSGAKETPRQKMIGMMYLVYTALLAMNVSADILDAFAIVNEGQEKTNASIEIKINDQYRMFEDQYNKEQAKTQLYWDKALAIREKTDEIVNFIEKDVMVPMLLQTEGLSEEDLFNPKDEASTIIRNKATEKRVIYEFDLSKVSAKDNYDTPMAFMLTEGKGTELKQKIQEYREFIVNTMESEGTGLTNYSQHVGLFTDVDKNGEKIEYKNKDGEIVDWEEKNFGHIVFVAQMAILNKLVGEIQTTEFDAVSALMNRIGASDYKFNSLQARVIAKSDYITQGQDYEAEVFIAALDTEREFDMEYGMGVSNFDNFRGTPVKANSQGGIVKLKIPGRTIGEQKLAGVIKMTNPETGEVENHPFSTSYMVAAPTATVAPTKMMIMYRGLKNPISVSAPGVSNDALIVNVEGGVLTTSNRSAGSYLVEPNSNATTVKVKVSYKDDNNRTVQLVSQDFRIKAVPNPVVQIRKELSGSVYKEVLRNAGGLEAKLADFDFEGYEFTVQSYTVTAIGGGTITDKKNNGANFSNEVIGLINSANPGQRLIFRDIVVKEPSGEMRPIKTSIIITLM